MITYISKLKKGDVFIADGCKSVLVDYDKGTQTGFITSIENYIFVEIQGKGVYGYTNGAYIQMQPEERVEYICSLSVEERYNIFCRGEKVNCKGVGR